VTQRFMLGVICVALSLAGSASAQTAVQRAQRDQIATVKNDDPDMTAAFAKARESLQDFLRLARKPRATIERMSVKVAIRDNDKTEYFWITPFAERDGAFVGRVANTPRSVRNVKLGKVIKFKEAEIADWSYVESKRMIGNFTACALIKKEPLPSREEFMKTYRLNCEF